MSGYRLRKCVPEKGVAVVRLSKLELWVRGAAALFFSLAFLVTFLPQGTLGFTVIGIDAWTQSVSFAFCAVGILAFMRALFWRIRVYGNRKYFNSIGRFINADTLNALEFASGEANLSGYNLYTYCFDNPVNLSDSDGTWPEWATKVAIGVAVIAVAAAVTVATGGAGAGVAGFIAAGVLKGAVIGATSGAAIGAIAGTASHVQRTGSWNGAGQAALEGGADGFMTGAIGGAVSGGMASSTRVGVAASKWGGAGGRSPLRNMSSHYRKHVTNEGHRYLGKNIVSYTNNARRFFLVNRPSMKLTSSGNYRIRATFSGYKAGGFYSRSGRIYSFF